MAAAAAPASTQATVGDDAIVERIRFALDHELFAVYEQPIIEIGSGRIVSHELLIRMLDPARGVIAPGAFLPVAERCGLIAEIDRWMIAEALTLAANGRPVHINVSGASVTDAGLADFVEDELLRTSADPSAVVFELTETALPHDHEVAQAFVRRVRRCGCGVALDDFGTGYGALTNLKTYDVDFLKIDVEFVRDLRSEPASQHVVRAIARLARDFGIRTIAEGVEDLETLPLLTTLGVEHAQGYAIRRPSPARALLRAASAR